MRIDEFYSEEGVGWWSMTYEAPVPEHAGLHLSRSNRGEGDHLNKGACFSHRCSVSLRGCHGFPSRKSIKMPQRAKCESNSQT